MEKNSDTFALTCGTWGKLSVLTDFYTNRNPNLEIEAGENYFRQMEVKITCKHCQNNITLSL